MPIRVVLGEMPRLLRDIVVDRISARDDMEISGEARGAGEIPELIADPETDVLVVAADASGTLGQADRFLRDRCRIKMLVLGANGRETFLFRLEPRMTPLGEVSPEGLVQAIRTAVRSEEAGATSGPGTN